MESIIGYTLREYKVNKQPKYGGFISMMIDGKELSREQVLDVAQLKCANCKGFSSSFECSRRDNSRYFHTKNFYLCETCKKLYKRHEMYCFYTTKDDKKLETKINKNIRLYCFKIFNLRKHQIHIKAILTLLNHRILPNELIRTLKKYLYQALA